MKQLPTFAYIARTGELLIRFDDEPVWQNMPDFGDGRLRFELPDDAFELYLTGEIGEEYQPRDPVEPPEST